MIDPAEALDALLEELKRQKSEGVRRVSVSDDSLRALRQLVTGVSPSPAPSPGAVTASPARPALPTTPLAPLAAPFTPPPIADAPVFTLAAGTKEQRMAALHALILACAETRKHLPAKQRPMLGQGSLAAKVVFVGEAPNAEEMEAGIPFAGATGELFQKILTAAGLAPTDVYIAPLMTWRPAAPTPFGKRPPNAREIAFNLPYLRAQLEIIQPQVIVALGAQAFEALHGRTPTITQARGQWFQLEATPLLATFHPNYLLHTSSASAKRTVWEDFLLLLTKLGLPISEKQRGYFALPKEEA